MFLDSDNNELLPCPCCRTTKVAIIIINGNYTIECPNCSLSYTSLENDFNIVKEYWNNRPNGWIHSAISPTTKWIDAWADGLRYPNTRFDLKRKIFEFQNSYGDFSEISNVNFWRTIPLKPY